MEKLAKQVFRILLTPVALVGLACIWLYVFFTCSFDQANYTISEILDL